MYVKEYWFCFNLESWKSMYICSNNTILKNKTGRVVVVRNSTSFTKNNVIFFVVNWM